MIDIDFLPLNITSHILKFRNFLKESWPYIDALMEKHDWDVDGDFIDDWLQVNWEFLVERELLGKEQYALTQFSITHFSKRITSLNKQATHAILVELKSDEGVGDLRTGKLLPKGKPIRLFSFRTSIEGGFGVYPPFDLAVLIDDVTKETYTLPIDALEFILAKLPGGRS